MAAIGKCTFFFAIGGHGWSETYYCNQPTITQCFAPCIQLGTALNAFRGNNTTLTNFRISLVNVPTNQGPAPRLTQLFPGSVLWTGGAVISPAITGGAQSDLFETSFLMRGVSSLEVPGTKSIFWGGMPDFFDQAGGVIYGQGNNPNVLVWIYGTQLVQNIQAALFQGGFGWLGQTQTSGSLAGAVYAINIVNGFAASIATTRNLWVGSSNIVNNPQCSVPMRISGLLQPGNLNGSWPMFITGPSSDGIYTCFFKKRIACLPYTSGGQLAFQPKVFIPFSNLWVGPSGGGMVNDAVGNLYAVKIARKKRGVPFGQQHGRRRAVPTY